MAMLQEPELQKDRRRIQALAEQNAKRTSRFLDARNRTIGIDKSSLDKQVEEKFQLKLLEKKHEQCEANSNEALVRYLENVERKAQETRQRINDEVKSTLWEQLSAPKNNAIRMGDPVNIDECRSSSLQRFSGEDREYSRRKRQQQEQVKNWCAQQIAEGDLIRKSKEEEKTKFAQSVLWQDEVRKQIENEVSDTRAKRTKDIQGANLNRSQQIRQEKRKEREELLKLDQNLLDHVNSNTSLGEQTDLKSSCTSHRVRTDHFTGFGKDQVRCIFEANDRVVEEKQKQERDDAEKEKYWATYNEELRQEMEEIEWQREQRRLEANSVQAGILKQQREELKTTQENMKQERFGVITDGFFQRFGTSCR